jgi:electron transfer flavoprotein beta subunit
MFDYFCSATTCCKLDKEGLGYLILKIKVRILINSMSLKIIVLAKQVPDTRNVGKDAMKADGTVNRAALPAIFNPEDLNALEQALRLKDAHPGTTVTLLTMGPGRAAEIIREGLYRGADGGFLLTDRAFAGADTLATSYALSMAIRKIATYDLIICGRQAIDGDTAQVGPQVAEKLGLSQITYTEAILKVENGRITAKRRLEQGVEIVETPLPTLITVNGSAPDCRPRNARYVQKYKHAKTVTEKQEADIDYTHLFSNRPYLNLQEWSVADVRADVVQCGLSGSPTKVKKIESVVFQAKESKTLEPTDGAIDELMKELITNHTIG